MNIFIREKEMTAEQKFERYSLSQYSYFADLRQENGILEGEFEKRYSGVFDQALSQIPKRDAKLFMLRNYGGKYLKDMGKKMDISRERVRQIERRAADRLYWRFHAVMHCIEEKYVKEKEERLQSELMDNKYGSALRYIFSKVNRLEGILTDVNQKIMTLEPNADYLAEKMKKEEILNKPIEIMGLSSRPYNALKNHRIEKIRDILTQTEDQMKTIRNLGGKSINEIKYSLSQYGLSLKN